MSSRHLQSARHLFQSPLYRSLDGRWRERFLPAVRDVTDSLTWDPGTILSILGFNYACGERTLFSEVKRLPWLASPKQSSRAELEEIPPHDLVWARPKAIAEVLGGLLKRETLKVAAEAERIYVLLSGGLDSRIIAATAAQLADEGEIGRPVAVTWGLKDSRDCVYARECARILGLEWIHEPLRPTHLLENINLAASALGGLVSPVHLHRMSVFADAPSEALVLAGNYGDMVGRAEFSGKKLLEQSLLEPRDPHGLMRASAVEFGRKRLLKSLRRLRERSPDDRYFVKVEHEMHAHYTRGLIAHAMSVIDRWCQVYQVFTDPSVYGFMWRLHPARRDDSIYAHLLEELDPDLARVPWARTNSSLVGHTVGARDDLREDFHSYEEWLDGEIGERVLADVDPEWFGDTGLFRTSAVDKLMRETVCPNSSEPRDSDRVATILWLSSIRRLAARIEEEGMCIAAFGSGDVGGLGKSKSELPEDLSRELAAYIPRRSKILRGYKSLRRKILRWKSIVEFPPRYLAREELWGLAENCVDER